MPEHTAAEIDALVEGTVRKFRSGQSLRAGTTPSSASPTVEDVVRATSRQRGRGATARKEPGFFPRVQRGLGEFFGAQLDTEGMRTSTSLDPIMGFLAARDTLSRLKTPSGAPSDLATISTVASDVATFGTIGKADAGLKSITDYASGKYESLDAAYTDNLRMERLRNAELRADNPVAELTTEMAAGFISGAAVARAGMAIANKAPFVQRIFFTPTASQTTVAKLGSSAARLGAGSAAAGGEVFVYSLNMNGDLEKAKIDAGIAALGGAVLGPLIGGGKGLGRLIVGAQPDDAVNWKVGKNIKDAVFQQLAKDGKLTDAQRARMDLTPQEINEFVSELGPDATLLDLVPGLRPTAARIVRDAKPGEGAEALNALLQTRRDLGASLVAPDGLVSMSLDDVVPRGREKFIQDTDKVYKDLSPKYDAIWEAYPEQVVDRRSLYNNFQDLLQPSGERTTVENIILRDFGDILKRQGKPPSAPKKPKGKQLRPAQKAAQKTIYSQLGRQEPLTLKQLHAIKIELGKRIKSGGYTIQGQTAKTDVQKAYTKDERAKLVTAYDFVNQKLSALNDDYAMLNKLYGEAASSKQAYEAGRKSISDQQFNDDDIALFLATGTKSDAAKAAFIEGMKSKLLSNLMNAGGGKKLQSALLDNAKMMKKIKETWGEEAGDRLRKSLEPKIMLLETAELIRNTNPAAIGLTAEQSDAILGAVDTAIATGGVTGTTSMAAAIGALRRRIAAATNPNSSATAIDKMWADAMGASGPGIEGILNALSKEAGPGSVRLMRSATTPAGIGGAIGTTAASENDPSARAVYIRQLQEQYGFNPFGR